MLGVFAMAQGLTVHGWLRWRSEAPLCWLMLACLAGCGAAARDAHAVQRVRFGPLGATTATYSTDSRSADAVRGPHAQQVSRGLEQALRRAHRELRPDARLGELGTWIARSLGPDGAPPPAQVLDLWARQLGLVEPTPHLIVLGDADAAGLQARASAELEAAARRQRYTHYGVATLERDGAAFAVLVLSWRWVELQPLPRSAPQAAKVQLRGSLLGGLRDAQLVVSYPDGSSERGPSQAGPRFNFNVPLHARGEHRVELLANSQLGVTVVANFPLYVGIEPTQEIQLAVAASEQLSEAQAKARFLRLINDERRRAGVPELEPDPVLDGIARAHSADMDAHGFVGHTSPSTGSAEQRVARAGVRTTLVLENIGRGASPEEVHRGLMDSPGHRANLIHALATHVGLGVVLTREGEHSTYLVTQLFLRRARKLDLGDADEQLRDAIDAARSKAGSSRLELDRDLSALCDDTARRFFGKGRPSREQLLDELQRRAAKLHTRYSRMAAVITVVSGIAEAASVEAFLQPRARALGLGLAQGTRADTVDNGIAIVALVAY